MQDTKKGTFVILQRNNKERSGMGDEKSSIVRRGAVELQHWLCVCMCVFVCVCLVIRLHDTERSTKGLLMKGVLLLYPC